MGIDCGGRMTELTGKHPFQMQNFHLNESLFLSRLTELIPAKKIDVAPLTLLKGNSAAKCSQQWPNQCQ